MTTPNQIPRPKENQRMTQQATRAPGEATYIRNARKLAIALDALRDIRDESAGAGDDYVHALANNALGRIEALGPAIGGDEPAGQVADGGHPGGCTCAECRYDREFERDAATLDTDLMEDM